MAAATMTPNRFGASITGQQNYSSIATSMADTLPSVDFNYNELRERMSQFTSRFDEFIERGRKRVLEERNTFRIHVAEIEETQRNRRQAITNLESKTSTHASTIAKEAAETEEMNDAIRSLTLQKEDHITHRDSLRETITSVQAAIKQRREAQTAHQRALDAQARHNVPELRFWEHCLGLRMEGTGVADQLRFVFGGMDERDGERECVFELQMGGKEYEVVGTQPVLEREGVEEMQSRLNESRELGAFLKGMRCLFAEALKA